MAANTAPIYPKTPVIAQALLSAASAIRVTTGITGLVDLYTAPAGDGVRVDSIQAKAQVTTTAGMVRIWLYSGSGNAQLIREIKIEANTASASNPAYEAEAVFDNLVLPVGWRLLLTTEKAEAINITMFGGAY